MKKGDIVFLPFPFTNLSDIKNRPALVLVSTDFDVTVAFITTQTKWQEDNDILVEPDGVNGLKKPSIIRLSKITTIEKSLIIGKLGDLKDYELKQVNESLMNLFNLH